MTLPNLTIGSVMSLYVLRLAIADQGVTETLRRPLEIDSNSLISNVALT